MIGGVEFSYVGAVEPNRDAAGRVIEEMPQFRYQNANNASLHKYGTGPFCRFQIANGLDRGAVFAILTGRSLAYIGQGKSLERRMSSNGMGGISPCDCFKKDGGDDGRQTNCRINNLILKAAKAGTLVSLWFHPVGASTAQRVQLRDRLIEALAPAWNLR